MKKFNLLLVLAISSALFMTSCEKDDPIIPNEEEVITTLNYTLTPEGGGTVIVLSFQDLDGDGGDAPVITGGTLAANTIYNGALTLLNEVENPAENITEEVEEEAIEHQFFFDISTSDITIAYMDLDANGFPIGLDTKLTTTNTGSATITVVLRHEPAKDATDVNTGDITNAGGETDIEVTFNVDVQ
ncbi:MAG: hypothetical protein ACI8ZX_001009 [Planctomycetota bacterium]|jgi:hypothetical protein